MQKNFIKYIRHKYNNTFNINSNIGLVRSIINQIANNAAYVHSECYIFNSFVQFNNFAYDAGERLKYCVQ